MCGIAGIVSKNDNIDYNIKKIVKMLSHRGPDYTDTFLHNNLALGHTRLSIIDLNERSHQPFHDDSGNFTIVFNGEIYNYKELKKELIKSGIVFRTESDTEVILNGFIKYGKSFFSKLIGFYSICIYEKQSNTLLLTRDAIGKKPLYYYHLGQNLIFCSELNPLVSTLDSTPEINIDGLSHYLWKGYFVDHHSAYCNIKQVLPGEFITFNLNSYDLKKYNSNASFKISTNNSISTNALDLVEENLNKSISYRFISDVPVSMLLSGGVDSSLITILAKKKLNYDFKTYYLGYGQGDDTFKNISENIASTLSLNHTNIEMSQPLLKDSINEMVKIFGEPFADYSALPSNQMYKEISKYSKVVISGDGADEIFFGYEDAKKFLLFSNVRKLFNLNLSQNMDNIYKNFSGDTYQKIYAYMLTFLGLNEESFSTALYNGGWNNYYRKNYMTTKGYASTGKNSIEITEMERFKNSGTNLMEKYLNYYLIRLTYDFMVKVDRTSMANSLEVRSPYLDRNMIKNIDGIGYKNNLDIFTSKKILKKLLVKYGFNYVTKAKKKGFTPPLSNWMQSADGIQTISSIISKKNNYLGEYFNMDGLKDLYSSKKAIKQNFFRLWNIMILSQWMKSNY